MTPLQRCLHRARLRLFVQRTVRCWGWLSLAALGVALLLADRLLALPVPWWGYLIVAGLVLLAGPMLAWFHLPQADATAALLDARLGLKDRLSTALFAHELGDDPMARQVIDEAQRTAGEVSLRQALPLKPGKTWGWVAPAAGIVAVLAVFVPGHVDLLGLHQAAKREQQRAQQTAEAQKQLAQASRLIEQVEHKQDAQQADPDKIMKELASLSQRDLRSPEMTKAAMAKLTEAQKQLDKARQAKAKQLQTVRNAMSQLEAAQRGPADRFADALRRGDFAGAQRELQALAQQIQNGQMSAAQKQALQHQLQRMAQQLQQQAQQAQQQQQAAQQKIQQTLSHAGVSQQQIQQLQKQGYNPQAVQQALQQAMQQNGMSQSQAQQQAQQLAKQIQQQQQQSGQGSPSQQANHGLSQAMQQMAQGLGPQRQSQQGQHGQQGQQGKQNQQGQQGKGNQQGQQGHSGGGQSQFAQGAWRGQQQLSQLARMQQQLQQMGVAQGQMQQAMQQLAGGSAGSRSGMMRRPNAMGGMAASRRPSGGAGTGSGGNPLGPTQQHIGPYKTQNQGDITPGQRGRVIASWLQNGPMTAGTPTVQFDQAVTQARDDAEQAVTENGVPQRYHQAIHDYFNQLPQSVAQARRQAPAAPR